MRRMHRVAVLTLAACAVPSALFAMGGGGYGGGFSSMRMPTRPDDYSAALKLIHQERYAEAMPCLDRAVAQHPHNADILNYLGYTHRMVGDYPGSLAWYRKALTEDPDHKGAHEYLGELYLNMRDVASARTQLAELVRLCPDTCDERDVLTKSIDTWVAANPPAAMPATAATAAAPASPATPSTSTPPTSPP
ncbi:MAG TPA: tetratricopeptide repeat protein, partial [Rhizomicrobium sp.]|nr:tetratricopeptide repeat protein [Rhizomicrobium sp.]